MKIELPVQSSMKILLTICMLMAVLLREDEELEVSMEAAQGQWMVKKVAIGVQLVRSVCLQQPEEQQQIGKEEMPLKHDREKETSSSGDVCGYGESCEMHGPASVHGEDCRDDGGSKKSRASSISSK